MTTRDDKKESLRSRRTSRRSLSFRVGSSLLTGALALGGCDKGASPEEKIHVNPAGPREVEEPSSPTEETEQEPETSDEEGKKKEQDAKQVAEPTSEDLQVIDPPVNPAKVEPKSGEEKSMKEDIELPELNPNLGPIDEK